MKRQKDGRPVHGRKQSLRPPIRIADSQGLETLMARAQETTAIAVDTESNSLYAYYYRICLIQLSLPDADYVIDPLAFDATPLGELFADPGRQKVLHAAENDILGLSRDFAFTFANIYDTMMAARILGWPRAGLAAILAEHFGVHLDKRLQRTNWGRRPLETDQLAYAQLDTHYLLSLRDHQIEELKALGRWEEAQESFAQLTSLEWREKQFDPDGFWSVNGARTLPPSQMAVLRELFLYREQEAQRLDRPPFKVFDQATLLDLTRKQPTSLRALRSIRGMSGRRIQRFGDGVVAAVKRGRAAPAPEPPQRRQNNGRPDPETQSRYDALRAWRTAQARQRGVDPDIVLTNDQLLTIARLSPSSIGDLMDSGVIGPWKVQEYGEAILKVLTNTSNHP